MIKYEMENAFKLDVPLDVELELVKTQHIRTLKLKLDSFRLKNPSEN
jgi:hypothetical protein